MCYDFRPADEKQIMFEKRVDDRHVLYSLEVINQMSSRHSLVLYRL